MKIQALLLLLLVLVFGLTGCKSKTSSQCTQDSQCLDNQACINGSCIDLGNTVCTVDSQCGSGKICLDQRCVEDETKCTTEIQCSPGRSCVAGRCQADDSAGTVLVESTGFGSENGQVNVDFGEEGEPVCPNSFAIDEKNNRIYLLDQLNLRIQVFVDGVFDRNLATPVDAYLRDIALAEDGSILVLDKDQRDQVLWLDSQGEIQKTLDIVGEYIDDADLVDGIEVRTDGIWLTIFGESGYEVQVQVADPNGDAVGKRQTVDGILSLDGSKLLRAVIDEATGAHIILSVQSRKSGSITTTKIGCQAECDFSGLTSDQAGNIYIFPYITQLDSSAAGRQSLVVVDVDGLIVHQANLRQQSAPAYPFRSVRVEPSGNIYQFEITENGGTVRRYSR